LTPTTGDPVIVSIAVKTCLLLVPPGLFLLLGAASAVLPVERWKYLTAGSIVSGWTGVVGVRLLVSRPCQIDGRYPRALRTSLVEHAILLVLAFLTLDMGQTLYACLLGCMLYWITLAVPVLRRPLAPSAADLFVARHGFLWLALGVVIVFSITESIRGY
jgi:hypothetical protein